MYGYQFQDATGVYFWYVNLRVICIQDRRRLLMIKCLRIPRSLCLDMMTPWHGNAFRITCHLPIYYKTVTLDPPSCNNGTVLDLFFHDIVMIRWLKLYYISRKHYHAFEYIFGSIFWPAVWWFCYANTFLRIREGSNKIITIPITSVIVLLVGTKHVRLWFSYHVRE